MFTTLSSILGALGRPGQLIQESAQDTITATAGGNQATAFQMNNEINKITVCASIGDAVKLPPSKPGVDIMVINKGAKSAQVYGAGTDTIDGVATAVGVPQMAGSSVYYICTTAGAWDTEGLATGYAGGGLQTMSYTDSIVAVDPGAQSTATLLTTMLNRVVTVAAANDGVKLQQAAGGLSITVTNAHASNAINVYPFLGDAINALAANTAFSVPAAKTCTFEAYGALQWHTLLSA